MYLPLNILLRSVVLVTVVDVVFGNNEQPAADRRMNLLVGLKRALGQSDRKIPAWNIVTITKRVPVPYPVTLKRRVPVRYEVLVDKPYPVFLPKPYPVIVEKKVRYQVKVPVPKPYPVIKRVPYPVKIEVEKPVPVEISEPIPFLVEKQVPVLVENEEIYSPTSADNGASLVDGRANFRGSIGVGGILQDDEQHSSNFNKFQQSSWDKEHIASTSDDAGDEDWQGVVSSLNVASTHTNYHGSGRKRDLKEDDDDDYYYDDSLLLTESIAVEEADENSKVTKKLSVINKFNDKNKAIRERH